MDKKNYNILEVLNEHDNKASYIYYCLPSWSPDGSKIVSTSLDGIITILKKVYE